MTKSYQAKCNENSTLVTPINHDEGQQDQSNKKRGYGLVGGVAALLCVASFYAGNASQGSSIRAVESSLVLESSGAVNCLPLLASSGGIGFITCLLRPMVPGIIQSALRPFDPIETPEQSAELEINIPTCPAVVSVTYGSVTIAGLSSLNFDGFELVEGTSGSNCINPFSSRPCTYSGTWTENASLSSLSVETEASLDGSLACFDQAVLDKKLSGRSSINDALISIKFSASGEFTLSPSFTIDNAHVESIALDFGSLDIGIDFSAWGKDVAEFEKSFEDFVPKAVTDYINEELPGRLNSILQGQLPLGF